MKTLLSALLLTAAMGFAQAAHTATLIWTDTQNPTGTVYNVYRATGLCSGSPTFSKIATAIAAKTYPDATIPVGNSCYAVTAVFNSAESGPSNASAAAVTPFPPVLGPVQVAGLIPGIVSVAMVEVFVPDCLEFEPEAIG